MTRKILALLAAVLLLAGCTNAESAGPQVPGAETSPAPQTGEPSTPAGSADDSAMRTDSPDESGVGNRNGADSAPFTPTLTIHDTETGESITVQAPESAVVRLAHDAKADRYAVAFLVDDGFRIYFPDEDEWQDVPLAIRPPGASGSGEREGALLMPRNEAAGWMLPLRLSPHFTGNQWDYLSRDNEIFRLDTDTGIAERIWSAPERRAVYGMSASPDGTRLAVLLTREGLGSEADAVVVDAASGTVLYERQGFVHVNKSDGILAHLHVEWLNNETFGFETLTKITEENGTVWKWGWLVLDADGGEPAKLWTVPGGRRFRFAPGMSRMAVETVETHDIILLDDGRSGTVIDDVLSVDGQSLPAGEPSTESGRLLGTGILLGWMRDRHVVWYQNESLQAIEDVFH